MIGSNTARRKIAIPGATATTFLLFIGLGLTACSGSSTSSSGSPSETVSQKDCIKSGDFDSNKDYFPDKSTFTDAKGLDVSYHKSYKVVTLKNPSNVSTKPQTYVLVQCGAPAPKLTGDLAGAEKITIPTSRVALGSTTEPLKFEMLGQTDAIAGTVQTAMINDPKLSSRVQSGAIKDFGLGNGTTDINTEKLVALKPDLFIISGHDDPAKYAKVQEMGIPVVAETDFLENSPLGRAEWIKYDALYTDSEGTANKQYATISSKYHQEAQRAKAVTTRPSVFSSFQMKGTWYVKPDENYSTQLIRDAGGSYVFSSVHGVADKQMDTEQILTKASSADFWLDGYIYSPPQTLSEIRSTDPRLASFKSVKTGNVWDATKAVGKGGGNDYWQLGVVRPDLVLGDLTAILQPQLDPHHDFTFYQKMPAK